MEDQLLHSDSNPEQPNEDSVTEEQAQDQDKVVDQGDKTPEISDDLKIKVGDEELTIAELKNGYMRQADYTRKTQELAKMRKGEASPDADEQSDEIKEVIETLKKHGVVTKEEIQQWKAQEEDTRLFNEVVMSNEVLKPHAEFIKAYGIAHPDLSWNDVVDQYVKTVGLADKIKLKKAKSSAEPVGQHTPVKEKEKGIMDMSDKEYEEWVAKQVDNGDLFI